MNFVENLQYIVSKARLRNSDPSMVSRPASHTEDSARIKFLGNEYWITRNHVDDEGLLEKKYAVIEMEDNYHEFEKVGEAGKVLWCHYLYGHDSLHNSFADLSRLSGEVVA